MKIQERVAWPPTSPLQVAAGSGGGVGWGGGRSSPSRSKRQLQQWLDPRNARSTLLGHTQNCPDHSLAGTSPKLPNLHVCKSRLGRFNVPTTPGARDVRPFRHAPPCGLPLSSCKSSPSPDAGSSPLSRAPGVVHERRPPPSRCRSLPSTQWVGELRGLRCGEVQRVVPSLNSTLGWSPGD